MRKVQENMKRQADKERQEEENWKKSNKLMLSTKDLIFKERLVKKLMERYIRLYKIEEIVLRNAVKLKLLVSMRIYLVVNINRVEKYKKLIRKQKVEEPNQN